MPVIFRCSEMLLSFPSPLYRVGHGSGENAGAVMSGAQEATVRKECDGGVRAYTEIEYPIR